LPEAEFAAWLEQGEGSNEHGGHELLEKHGCLGCHSEDGSTKVGPTFKGIWGRSVTVVTAGAVRTITVDGVYLRRSILEPGADIVKGFPPIMPPFSLKEEELAAIITYLKGLK
jgi:cytochrome c oxidase subunit 2